MKYVFFDVDNTLWDDEFRIPESARFALRALHASGHKIFLNSGRSRANLQDPALQELPFDGFVAACGCHIEEDGETLYEYTVPWELTERVLELLPAEHMPFVAEGTDYCYFNLEDFPDDPYVSILYERLGPLAKRLSEITPESRINKFSADIHSDTDFEKVKRLLPEMTFINHDNFVVEVVPKGFSKATGLEHLAALRGIRREDIYVFGDGMNDLEAFRFAGHPIAMRNANPVLLPLAEYVTGTLQEDGILEALLHYGLIKAPRP